MRLDQDDISLGLLAIHLSLGLKAVTLTISWINQVILQMGTWVMADSNTRQYCIFQQYLPTHSSSLRSWLLKKCKLSRMQSLEIFGVTNDAHREKCQQSGTSHMGTNSERS